MQNQKADGQGEMDSGDILAYSGEISGQTAAPDLLEEKEGGNNQATSPVPEKPKPQPPTPAPAPAQQKQAVSKPAVEQKEATPAQPATQKASEPPAEPQNQKEKVIQEKAIETNKERQLQTQKDMQEAQSNL